MQFHGTVSVSEIGAFQCPWNFNRISWNCSCDRNWRTASSMELHGVQLNCSCHRNWPNPSYMEFIGFSWNCSCQRIWRTPYDRNHINNAIYLCGWCCVFRIRYALTYLCSPEPVTYLYFFRRFILTSFRKISHETGRVNPCLTVSQNWNPLAMWRH